MQNKESDVKYCGVNQEKIRNANPKINLEELKIHHIYLTERHEIYKKKEIQKLPQESWTEDPVFKQYRFTNVRRELDRESKWLIEKISNNPNMALEEKVLWSILFRTFNKSETFRRLHLPESINILTFGDKEMTLLREAIEEEMERDPKYVWFTPAFNTGGLKYANAFPEKIASKAYLNQPRLEVVGILNDGTEKEMIYKEARDAFEAGEIKDIKGWEQNIPMRMFHMIKNIRDNGIHKIILEATDQKQAYETILSVHGLAKFLAYQIWVDLTYIPEYKFSENEFVISGPGCDRGIDMLFEDKDGMTYEECLFWLRDNLERLWKENGLEYYPDELFDHLPEYDQNYNVMMLENSFCEHQKNSKARKGTGRPRNTYKPTKENNTLENFL